MSEYTSPGLTIGPPDWIHPVYSGSDAAYQAWLAQQDAAARDAISQAKLRKQQLEDAYTNALADMDRQAVFGRRNIQTGMLQRGLFRSGETDRRQSEFDAQVAQGKENAHRALTDQEGQVDLTRQSFLSGIASQAATQVSQAMLRDALAAYNAQQAAATAAPAAVAEPSFAPQQQQQQAAAQGHPKTFTPSVPAHPNYNPVTSSAGLYQAQSKPKPKPASGTTGKLTQSTKPGKLQ